VGGATFIGYPLGPILGGWLLDNYWWGSVFLINVPIVVIALAAVVFLMPESRGSGKFRVDGTGVVLSSAGLAALTYGVIQAGQDGWSDSRAVGTMLAGAIMLAAFVIWEQHVGRRGRQPLVDLSLFRSAGFTWGTTLATMISFALFGLTFAMPQFFLDVKGLNSFASGIRLLPLIGGLAVGLGVGQRLQSPRKSGNGEPARPPLLGARPVGAGGFAIMAAALAVGTATAAGSGTGFVSAWFAVTGLGLGLAMPTMLNAALSALTPERSGSGSALMTAMRQVGATIGVAVLGTVLSSVYRGKLALTGLPADMVATAKGSVGSGVAAAQRLGSPQLLAAVHGAYADGVDVMLWVCAAIAIAAAVLAALFLPRQPGGPIRPGGPVQASGTVQATAAGVADAELGAARAE
jgi:DHA2 family multidrug resistance protein-like MFS transporter